MTAPLLPAELEVKFFPVDPDELRQRLRDNGAERTHPERLMRRTQYAKRNNPQLHGDYIRVRDEGDLVRVSLKVHANPDGAVGDQREIDIVTNDFDHAVMLIDGIGLTRTNYQENRRETWRLGGSEVTIDFWPGLAPYAEIEAATESELELLAGLLCFDWGARRLGTVVHLYAETYGKPHDECMELISHCTFEQNPFDGMPRAA